MRLIAESDFWKLFPDALIGVLVLLVVLLRGR
jgi:hypothetical protein